MSLPLIRSLPTSHLASPSTPPPYLIDASASRRSNCHHPLKLRHCDSGRPRHCTTRAGSTWAHAFKKP
eukprot:9444895-Pyramimonas_sp.AAC.1